MSQTTLTLDHQKCGRTRRRAVDSGGCRVTPAPPLPLSTGRGGVGPRRPAARQGTWAQLSRGIRSMSESEFLRNTAGDLERLADSGEPWERTAARRLQRVLCDECLRAALGHDDPDVRIVAIRTF